MIDLRSHERRYICNDSLCVRGLAMETRRARKIGRVEEKELNVRFHRHRHQPGNGGGDRSVFMLDVGVVIFPKFGQIKTEIKTEKVSGLTIF